MYPTYVSYIQFSNHWPGCRHIHHDYKHVSAPDLMAVDYRHTDHVHKDIHVSAHDFIA